MSRYHHDRRAAIQVVSNLPFSYILHLVGFRHHPKTPINASQIFYQPRPANLSSAAIVPQLIPTMASPSPALHSAKTLASW